MICKHNNKYYIKRARKLVEIDVVLGKNGNVQLLPKHDSVISVDKSLDYSIITLDELKKEFVKNESKSNESTEANSDVDTTKKRKFNNFKYKLED